MRSRDKIRPPFYPILKPADLPDFFAAARIVQIVGISREWREDKAHLG